MFSQSKTASVVVVTDVRMGLTDKWMSLTDIWTAMAIVQMTSTYIWSFYHQLYPSTSQASREVENSIDLSKYF